MPQTDEEKAQNPTQFATDNVPPGEDPPPQDDPEALSFLKSRGWPSDKTD